jgi:hypothetical protein
MRTHRPQGGHEGNASENRPRVKCGNILAKGKDGDTALRRNMFEFRDLPGWIREIQAMPLGSGGQPLAPVVRKLEVVHPAFGVRAHSRVTHWLMESSRLHWRSEPLASPPVECQEF